jgi:pimeloyl-ACP methyl ester carboxylesterase
VRESWADVADARLYVAEDGDGPALVMLHGGMADHRAAWPVVAPLAGRLRVVTPDQRGSGRSHCGRPLSFDLLADDLASVLDRLGLRHAIVGGISGGAGVALRFALRHPVRVLGLVLVRPVHAGSERGYSAQQAATFAAMDAVASRAVAEGVQVLRPLYASLPPGVRDKALAMIEDFDAASVVETSHFVASGAQPFAAAQELRMIATPTLLVRGDDPMHPGDVSDLYATSIPNCVVLSATTGDVSGSIGEFCDRCLGGSATMTLTGTVP